MKNLDGEYISRVLRFSSDNRLVQGLADRIFRCSECANLYTANDLHTEDGELYEGRGQLWACNSRLCPTCTGRLAKRNRRIARYVFDFEKIYVGENWYFLTFTMPDLSLKDLPLLTCRSVINEAWRKFSRSKFFKEVCRGGFKNEEFTVGDYGQYHYHIHSLAICRSRIQSNNFQEIRYHWTKALEFSFQKHGIQFECNTSDGLAVCNVQKVWNQNRSINELCKYITKTTDWAKIPPEQLADIATIKRFPRMFEVFGVCKETAKQMRPEPKETPDTDTYLDTKKITDENSVDSMDAIEAEKISDNGETEKSDAPKKKKPTWRELCRILPREKWLEHLEQEISKVQDYRRRQLREKFAFASFRTLDGEIF
ncbi:MAG: protein rep [Pyrinomonadaceae bacterium]|nr:protein rep [Pyrinomonadaceae bacterium]